jgi:hypothetical protein
LKLLLCVFGFVFEAAQEKAPPFVYPETAGKRHPVALSTGWQQVYDTKQ